MKINVPLDREDAVDLLRDFIRDRVTGAGFSHAVLGVSGGVDSALSTYLAARALGPENVLVLRMPYETSTGDTMEDAQAVINDTGVRSKTFSITEGVDGILEDLPEAGKVRRGNVMARVRMIYLYDQAKDFGGLVVGTGNKTEVLLGYSTLHGDGAFDLNPLGDLYKTQVWNLARHLDVPEQIISKPPSAGLWAGQTDEEELGFSYQDVDQVLYMLVEKGESVEACVEEGFSREFVSEVIERVKRFRFKSQLPPVGSIGQQPLSILDQLPAFTGS